MASLSQLPYGTLTDDEMRAMPIPMLQDEGLLFLWVTGRAMEVGRECMRVWGYVEYQILRSLLDELKELKELIRYTRVDEVIWLKTNQVPGFSKTSFNQLAH